MMLKIDSYQEKKNVVLHFEQNSMQCVNDTRFAALYNSPMRVYNGSFYES